MARMKRLFLAMMPRYNLNMDDTLETLRTLDELLIPLGPTLSRELAKALAELKVDQRIQTQMDDLADKNTEGMLTEEEHAKYRSLVSATSLLSVLKARARATLRQPTGRS
jgi:hypothetical protein